MKCTNCGNELKENAKFCDECGTPVVKEKETEPKKMKAVIEPLKEEDKVSDIEISTEKSDNNLLAKFNALDTPKKVIIGVCGVLALVLVIAIIGSGSNSSNNSNNTNNNYQPNVEFNDEVVTAIPEEEVTQAPMNIEVEIMKSKIYDYLCGLVEVDDYSIVKHEFGYTLEIRVKVVQKDKDTNDYFSVPFSAYDKNGNLVDTGNMLCSGWKYSEIGDILKGDSMIYAQSTAFPEKADVAKIEIG